MQELDAFPTLESALSARFRGQLNRNFSQWREKHAYNEAGDIPVDAKNVWLGRQKHNYRGIGERLNLRHLISGNVDQPFLEEIGNLANLERLELEWPMIAHDLTPLLGLTKLAFLSIDSPRNISNFRPILDLPALQTLIITNPKRMDDLTWLREAHHLEVIGIEGGMDSPYKIPSLEPLRGLRSLSAFLGVSTRLADRSLAPLAHCPNLAYLGIACVAPKDEFDRLKAAKPGLACDWFRAEMWTALRATR